MKSISIFLLGMYLTVLATSADSQVVPSPRRIGFLVGSTPAAAQFQVDCFAAEMKDRKWLEGSTLITEYRWTGGTPARSAEFAAELVRSKPDIIIATGTVAGQAAHKATKDIPIVFAALTDPVDAGLVQSFARPGGNVTGISNYFSGTTAKLIDLLLAISPGKKRFGVIYNPANPAKRVEMAELTPMVHSIGGEVIALEMRVDADFEPTLAAAPKIDALVTLHDGLTATNLAKIIGFAAQAKAPSVYQIRQYVDAGGLMSYGVDYCQHLRRAAAYADRILKGTHPSELPVELPTRFELIINRKTADFLGLDIPISLLARTDEVIE